MTTGTSPDPVPWRVRWAAEQLGVNPQVAPEAARAAFLRRLAEVDFVPPAEWRRALQLLGGVPLNVADHQADAVALRHEMERLRPEVEAFAGKFWTLPPDERRRCWDGLLERCLMVPALLARLRRLEPGLGLATAPDVPGKLVSELGREIQALFVLRPAEQAARRLALVQAARDLPEAWETAARQLRQSWPALAALQADFVDELASCTQLRFQRRQRRDAARASQKKRAPATAGQGSSLRWIWILVVVGGGLVRAVGNFSSSSHSPSPPYSYSTPPVLDTRGLSLPTQTFRFTPQDGPNPWEDGIGPRRGGTARTRAPSPPALGPSTARQAPPLSGSTGRQSP